MMTTEILVRMTRVTSYILLTVMLIHSAATESCSKTPGDSLSDDARSCMRMENFLEQFTDLFNIAFWERLCRQSDVLQQCLSAALDRCGSEYVSEVFRVAMTHMHTRVGVWIPSVDSLLRMTQEGCSGADIRDSIRDLYNLANNLTCMNERTRSGVTDCIAVWLDEMTDIRDSGNTTDTVSNQRRESLIRFGRSSFQCARNLVRVNCSDGAQDLLVYAINQTVPDDLKPYFTRDQVKTHLNETYIMSTERNTVGVYGDPHVLIFNLSSPITCSVPGHVTYLSNQLFRITGDNRVISTNGPTVLSRLGIEFYQSGGGVVGEYVTEADTLATTFDFEDLVLRPDGRPVEIVTVDPGVKVQINSTSEAYIILIQRRPGGLMFTIRISEGVLKRSSGILISGCSHNKHHVIDLSTEMKHIEADEPCLEKCKNMWVQIRDTLTDLTQTCVFECVKTGDIGSTKAFRDAIIDSRDNDDGLSLVEPPPTPARPHISGATPLHVTAYHRLLIIMVVFFETMC